MHVGTWVTASRINASSKHSRVTARHDHDEMLELAGSVAMEERSLVVASELQSGPAQDVPSTSVNGRSRASRRRACNRNGCARRARSTCFCCMLSFMLTLLLAWNGLLELVPQVGFFLFSSCRHRLSIPFIKGFFDSTLDALPAPVRPWLRRHFEASQPALDRKNASVVLVGADHKTGSELAKKLVSVLCGQLSLCCYLMTGVTAPHLNELLADPAEPLDVLFSNHFSFLRNEIEPPYSHLVFFFRKPFRLALSAFAYHGHGMEGGHAFPKSACATGGLPPTSEAEIRRLCQHFGGACLDAHAIPAGSSPAAASSPASRPMQALSPAVYAFLCGALRAWQGYDAMDAWANASAHPSGLAAMAASYWFQSYAMARVVNASMAGSASAASLPSPSSPPSAAQLVTDPDGPSHPHLDRNGRRMLVIDIDLMMGDYAAHITSLLDFVSEGFPRIPRSRTRGLAGALNAYDVQHSWSLEAFYERFGTGHVSSYDQQTKQALLEGLASFPNAREAHRPILELLGPEYGALW